MYTETDIFIFDQSMLSHKDFAVQFAYQAGEISRTNFLKTKEVEYKADHTMVTDTDKAINSLLIQEVQKNFPDHSIQWEEESLIKSNASFTWICDPVDGTHPFVNSIPVFTFWMALLHNNEIILGVIYDPIMDRMYVAEKWMGAYCNNKAIHVSTQSDLENNYIAMYAGARWRTDRYDLLDMQYQLKIQNKKARDAISIHYMGALTASGNFMACIFAGKSNRDMAPISILVKEAWGKVTDLRWNPEDYSQPVKGQIASNWLIHDELVEMAQKYLR